MTIYERALDFVTEGDVGGLGSGRASTAFIRVRSAACDAVGSLS